METTEIVRLAREAWERLKTHKTWQDWLTLAEGLLVGRHESFAISHTNDPKNKRYRNAFSDWLNQNGFADMDSGERSRLFECMQHRAEIEQWRATLTAPQLRRLNHPQTVLTRWKAATRVPTEAKAGFREEVVRLQSELDAAHERIKALQEDRGPLITVRDAPEQIAHVLLEWLPPRKRRAVAEALLRETATKKIA